MNCGERCYIVPVRIIENNGVSCLQIDSLASGPCRCNKNVFPAARSVEFINDHLSEDWIGSAIEATVVNALHVQIVANDVDNTGELRKYHNAVSLDQQSFQ